MRITLSLAILAMTATIGFAQTVSLKVNIINNSGKAIGTANISSGKNATVIRVNLVAGALAPGWHGIHLHAKGDCSDHATFKASKGHVNHGGKKHGLLNAQGPDDGDLPNIFANANGSVNAEISTPTTLKMLKDADGAAIVIHAKPDDHLAQPIGGAGPRVGCGVIK